MSSEEIKGETVQLDHPFVWEKDEGKVTEIKVCRPKAVHMRGINFKKISEEGDEMLKLVQKLTGHPPRFIDKIDFLDLQKIMGVINDFLDSGPKAGKTS